MRWESAPDLASLETCPWRCLQERTPASLFSRALEISLTMEPQRTGLLGAPGCVSQEAQPECCTNRGFGNQSFIFSSSLWAPSACRTRGQRGPQSCAYKQGPCLVFVADPACGHPNSHFSHFINRALIWCQQPCAQPWGLI